MTHELWRLSATELTARIASREVSSREATQSVLARLDAVNPAINAVVQDLRTEALAAADTADRLLAQGISLGPLHGLPVTTKVNVDQRGCATTNGVVANASLIADSDSPTVANWRKAGAVFVGRTNTPAFSWRWFTDNDLHGRTLNPWNPAITPGGSSGGAASAVAAGIGHLGHANDLGGSIRYPAYCCGVPGIRPTIGRVPAFNPSASADRPFTAQLFGVQGVVARSVRDVRLGLRAMAHEDARDPLWTPAPWTFGDEPSRRVALFSPAPSHSDPEVLDSLADAANALVAAGYEVEAAEPPSFDECAELWRTLIVNEVRIGMFPTIESEGDEAIKLSSRAIDRLTPRISMEGFSRALMRRNALLRQWQIFMQRYPLILMPVSLRKPFVQDFDLGDDARMNDILRTQSPLLALVPLGLPVMTVPTGLRAGLPSGVQIVAPRFREEACLLAGEAVERAFKPATPIDPRAA